MRVHVDGVDLAVNFMYENDFVNHKNEVYPTVVTVCEIKEIPDTGPMEDGELVTDGETICSLWDEFSKIKGRKIALDRALRSSDSPFAEDKLTRRYIWHQYLQKCRYAEGKRPMKPEEVERIEERLSNRKRALTEGYTNGNR